MKLYATITSERATKGQGGNKYLDIVIRNEKAEIIANVSFYPDNEVANRITIRDDIEIDIDRLREIKINSWDSLDSQSKGKKQKGKNDYTKLKFYPQKGSSFEIK